MNPSLRARLSLPLFFIDMILFGLAYNLLDASAVLPEFVRGATDSQVLIGITGILWAFMWRLPQLLVAPTLNRAENKMKWLAFSAIPGRFMFCLIGIVTLLVGRDQPNLMLITFFFGYALFGVTDGITALVWVELIGSAVSDRARGVMLSASQIVNGVLVLAMQIPVRYVLSQEGPGYPNSYGILFVVAGVMFVVSGFALISVQDNTKKTKAKGLELRDYVPFFGKILRQDHPFRAFLLMRFFLEISFYIVSPFYIGFMTIGLGINPAQAVSDSLLAVTVGNIGGSIFAAWISNRGSARVVIWGMGIAAILGPVLALLSPLFGSTVGYLALMVTFITIGIERSGGAPGFMNWLIAYPMPGSRGIYAGIANTIGIASLAAPVIGGVIVSAFGYTSLFVISGVTGGIALLFAFQLAVPQGQGIYGSTDEIRTHDSHPISDV
jgi:MFS family permease